LADGGQKTTPCCRQATDDEIREQPELFDCTSCGVARLDQLWPENVEALRCYQTLCGRTVRVFELREWALEQFTADLSLRERASLLDRLDVILDVFAPESTADGSDQT